MLAGIEVLLPRGTFFDIFWKLQLKTTAVISPGDQSLLLVLRLLLLSDTPTRAGAHGSVDTSQGLKLKHPSAAATPGLKLKPTSDTTPRTPKSHINY